jgi:NhaP-type Na+/H+ and K+/H+ antiporter
MSLSIITALLAIRRYINVSLLLVDAKEQLPSRGVLNWAYLAMAVSIIAAILVGLFWKNDTCINCTT